MPCSSTFDGKWLRTVRSKVSVELMVKLARKGCSLYLLTNKDIQTALIVCSNIILQSLTFGEFGYESFCLLFTPVSCPFLKSGAPEGLPTVRVAIKAPSEKSIPRVSVRDLVFLSPIRQYYCYYLPNIICRQ